MLANLINSPLDFPCVFDRYASGVVFRLAFGKKIQDQDDPYLPRILKVVQELERIASPGAYLVDSFPSLMRLPKLIAPFKQELERLHKEEYSLFSQLMEDVRSEIKAGTAKDCWEKIALETQSKTGLSDGLIAYAIGTMYEAGSGTAASALMSFILAMVHSPEWQQRVQEEVDQVVGSDRLPELDDLPQLPTVRAVIKEVLRWRPVTAGGLPHRLDKDDVYNGFFLPKDSVIHPNQW
jgi:cytochrome P450